MRTNRTLRIAVRASAWVLPAALVLIGGGAAGRQSASPTQAGISLTPSVVMLTGKPGQAHRRTLRLTNHTTRELRFTLEAQDVVASEGQRVFLAGGERSDSIAATAVFAPKEVVIAPGAVGVADVTLTVPHGTAVRGVAAIFRGQTIVGRQRGVAMTASLGALITFTLSNDVRLDAAGPEISQQTSTTPLAITKWVTNVGSEPVVASGAAALLDEAGALIGKVPVESQRLMPGERLAFHADYGTLVGPGRYRALLSLEYGDHERKVLTRTADVVVPSDRDDRRDADRSAGLPR